MLDAIKLRAHPKYLWSRRVYILKLEWIHPEWLRALVALLIAAPIYFIVVSGFAVMILLVPFVLLVKFFWRQLGYGNLVRSLWLLIL